MNRYISCDPKAQHTQKAFVNHSESIEMHGHNVLGNPNSPDQQCMPIDCNQSFDQLRTLYNFGGMVLSDSYHPFFWYISSNFSNLPHVFSLTCAVYSPTPQQSTAHNLVFNDSNPLHCHANFWNLPILTETISASPNKTPDAICAGRPNPQLASTPLPPARSHSAQRPPANTSPRPWSVAQ